MKVKGLFGDRVHCKGIRGVSQGMEVYEIFKMPYLTDLMYCDQPEIALRGPILTGATATRAISGQTESPDPLSS